MLGSGVGLEHRGEGVGARGGVGRRGGGGELEELRDAREIEVVQREAAVAVGGGGVPPARRAEEGERGAPAVQDGERALERGAVAQQRGMAQLCECGQLA